MGGAPISEYQILVYDSDNNGLGFISTGLNRSYVLRTISNYTLVNGEMYSIVIRAINRDGLTDSDYDNRPSASPMGLPDAPSGLQVQTGNHQMSISFNQLNTAPNAPPNDEGSAVQHYKVYRDSVLIHTLTPAELTYIDTSLQNGVVHNYQVSAVNGNGEGALSNVVSQSASNVPDVPSGLTAVHGHGQVMLSWNLLNSAPYPASNPSDEGRNILLYSIYQSMDNITFNLATTVSGSTNHATINNLVNGNTYYFEVGATNIIGSSSLSAPVSCVPSDSPLVPQSVVLYPYDSGVEISWEAPANDPSGKPSGGLAFTYNLMIHDLGGGLAYQASAITTPLVNITGLNDNQTYNLQLFANNGVDTDYNIYSANFNVIPNPVAISNLQLQSQNQSQVSLQFSYQSNVYSISQFLLSVVDLTLSQAGYAVIDPASQIGLAGDLFTYNFSLHSATVNMPSLHSSDRLMIAMYAINQLGEVSPISNVLALN